MLLLGELVLLAGELETPHVNTAAKAAAMPAVSLMPVSRILL
jgi:hypothetical protein